LVMYFIYYAEVMWFSRGNVLKQFFNLRAWIEISWMKRANPTRRMHSWSDIFDRYNTPSEWA
jgi:hypothetical protein